MVLVEVEEVVEGPNSHGGLPLRVARVEEATSRHKGQGSGPPRGTTYFFCLKYMFLSSLSSNFLKSTFAPFLVLAELI